MIAISKVIQYGTAQIQFPEGVSEMFPVLLPCYDRLWDSSSHTSAGHKTLLPLTVKFGQNLRPETRLRMRALCAIMA
jgi:hypothetical protein